MTEMVFEMLVFSPLNHLTWLKAQENFIILGHQEHNNSQIIFCHSSNFSAYLAKFDLRE
jgi:hypothetical protein